MGIFATTTVQLTVLGVFFLAAPHGLWDHSSTTRDQTPTLNCESTMS